MYYELYVDSLFLLNFVMNLYLLLLVNHSTFRTATRKRMVLGAGAGAAAYLLPFVLPCPGWLGSLLGMIGGTMAMITVSFRIRTFQGFVNVMEKLFLYSLLLGGSLLLLVKKVPFFRSRMMGTAGVLGAGGILFFLISYLQEHWRRRPYVCRATLVYQGFRASVAALVDSGNSLYEPVSGKPVSVIDREVFTRLWKEEPLLYRAVPYHSIGKKRGILQGYLLPELQIETNGLVKYFREVYVAVCDEEISDCNEGQDCQVKMLLHPALLTGNAGRLEKRRGC